LVHRFETFFYLSFDYQSCNHYLSSKLTSNVSFFKLESIRSFLINLAVTERCTSTQRTHHFLATFSYVNNDCIEIDELLLQIADYKNDYVDMAAEKLFRKCSTSWEAYQYMRDRVHDDWLPDSARQQLRRIAKKIQVQMQQSREYGWAYEYS